MAGGADIRSSAGASLAGRSIVVTRAAHQSKALIEPLKALGARVVVCPVIATVEPDDWSPADTAIANLETYDWIVLTSANAVRCFFARLEALGARIADAPHARIAVVGKATAHVLREHGVEPDLMPADFRAEGLLEAFSALGVGAGARVLVPRALEAREILPDTLRERGAIVDVVPVYRTVAATPGPEALAELTTGSIDAVTFTSPSTFRNFRLALAGAGIDADAMLRSTAIAAIGPVTSDAVLEAGHEVAVEPAEYTIPALVAALVEHFAG